MSRHPEQIQPGRGQWVRSAVDFGALLAFGLAFAVARLRGLEGSEAMIQATAVLVVASVIALAVGWFVERRLAPLPAIAGGFALVFGGLTLLFHDDTFVKLKLTVQNLLMAAVLLGGLAINRLPFKFLLGETLRLPDFAWRALTLRYGLFFIAVAAVNEVLRSQASVDRLWALAGAEGPDANDVWTSFRVSLWVAASAFGIAQVPYIMRHMQKGEPPAAPPTPDPGL